MASTSSAAPAADAVPQTVVTAEQLVPAAPGPASASPPEASPKGEAADRRAAADMSVKLSTQLMTIAVGLMAAEAALCIYSFTYRQTGPWTWAFAFLTASALVASFLFGGKGITIARNAGFEGDWALGRARSRFNNQGRAGLASLLLFLCLAASIAASDRLADASAGEMRRLAEEAAVMKASGAAMQQRLSALTAEVGSLKLEVDSLKRAATTVAPAPTTAAVGAAKASGP